MTFCVPVAGLAVVAGGGGCWNFFVAVGGFS